MTAYLSNAFSLNMLDPEVTSIRVSNNVEWDHEMVFDGERPVFPISDLVSIIGHQDLAELIRKRTELPAAFNRASVTLKPFDMLLVAQYSGPRLPEGATTLPEGAHIRWVLVYLEKECEVCGETDWDGDQCLTCLQEAENRLWEEAPCCGIPEAPHHGCCDHSWVRCSICGVAGPTRCTSGQEATHTRVGDKVYCKEHTKRRVC